MTNIRAVLLSVIVGSFFLHGSAFADEASVSAELDPWEKRPFAVDLQTGILTPSGFAGVQATYAPLPSFYLGLAGGVNFSDDGFGWRAAVGGGARLFQERQHMLSLELWVSVGSWDSILIDPSASDEGGYWDAMVMGHLQLAYEVRIAEVVGFRMFVGAVSNFGQNPSNNTCTAACDGPRIAPTTGFSIGPRF